LILEILILVVGIALIFKGSDLFVDASIAIGRIAHLPRVVVGGTIVSLATTTPELTVAIIAGINKVPELALGNALGSVAANIGLILALAAVISPFKLASGEFRWRSALMLGLVIVLILMTLDLRLPQWRGLILVGIGMIYLFIDYRQGRNLNTKHAEVSAETANIRLKSRRVIMSFFLIGAAMVTGGSQLLVNSGTAIAEAIGVPPVFIGLTMVAIGTSLPELATTVTAVRKRVFDLSVGNLIGANILNLTIIIGTTACISPLTLNTITQIYTIPVILVILSVFFLIVSIKSRLTRRDGILLIMLYLIFISATIVFNLEDISI